MVLPVVGGDRLLQVAFRDSLGEVEGFDRPEVSATDLP